MTYLLLVRHSIPNVQPEEAPEKWVLTDEGRRRCVVLAERLKTYHPAVVISSAEVKAAQTGQVIAETLALPFDFAPDLNEHRRSAGQYYPKRSDFEAVVQNFFTHPEKLVFGEETAEQAYNRFSSAIATIVKKHPGQNIAISTHATVLSLFVSRHAQVEAFPLWQSLGMPAFVVLELPDFRLVEIIYKLREYTIPPITYGIAAEADVPSIRETAEDSWHATYKDIFEAAFINDFLAHNYSEQALRQSIANDRTIFFVAREGNQVVGYCHFGPPMMAATSGNGELYRLYIRSSHWRNGIGARLMDMMLERAKASGMAEVFLYVHSQNDVGKSFYLKQGFTHDTSRDKGEEWCMAKSL